MHRLLSIFQTPIKSITLSMPSKWLRITSVVSTNFLFLPWEIRSTMWPSLVWLAFMLNCRFGIEWSQFNGFSNPSTSHYPDQPFICTGNLWHHSTTVLNNPIHLMSQLGWRLWQFATSNCSSWNILNSKSLRFLRSHLCMRSNEVRRSYSIKPNP